MRQDALNVCYRILSYLLWYTLCLCRLTKYTWRQPFKRGVPWNPLDLPMLYVVTSIRREAVIAPRDANYTPGWKLVKLRTSIIYKFLVAHYSFSSHVQWPTTSHFDTSVKYTFSYWLAALQHVMWFQSALMATALLYNTDHHVSQMATCGVLI